MAGRTSGGALAAMAEVARRRGRTTHRGEPVAVRGQGLLGTGISQGSRRGEPLATAGTAGRSAADWRAAGGEIGRAHV